MKRRVLYIQYTNPGGYPPLEHSSRILAERGWEVRFLGVGALGGADVLEFPPHPSIEVRKWRYCPPGTRQKLHFLAYGLWALWTTLTWRPDWVYASDPMSCPAALALSFVPGVRLLYHEHDSPEPASGAGGRHASDHAWARDGDHAGRGGVEGGPEVSRFWRFVLWSRTRVARRADLCVLPNEERVAAFRTSTATTREVECVWNCPARNDALEARPGRGPQSLRLFYHGSIVPRRQLVAVIEGMARAGVPSELSVAGYETSGSTGHLEQLNTEAERRGLAARLRLLGPIQRCRLIGLCAEADAGLALMPMRCLDLNERAMVGASNKSFDYLAAGVALLVSDLPPWRGTFVGPGYGLACDPDDPESVAAALRWFAEHPEETRDMGERGRQRILAEWNYEAEFGPVLARLEGGRRSGR